MKVDQTDPSHLQPVEDDGEEPLGEVVAEVAVALAHGTHSAAVQLVRLRGTAYDTWSQQIQRDRGRGLRQVGNARLVRVNGVKAKADPRATVTVTVCYDVSKVDIVDMAGKSVVTKDRANRAQAVYTVEQFDGGWYITDDDTRGKPCGA